MCENDIGGRQKYATYLAEAVKRKDKPDDVLDFQKDLDLTSEDIRFVHGKLIAVYLERAMEDDSFHIGEKDHLDKLLGD